MQEDAELIIVSDMDGVVAQSQTPILGAFNERFGTSLTEADWKTFDYLTLEAVRLSDEPVTTVAQWLYGEHVVNQAATIPESVEAIRILTSYGISPKVVTSRPSEQAESTRNWIYENFPKIREVHVRSPEHSTMRGEEFKVFMLGELKANVYIEDDPSVIEVVCKLIKNGELPHLIMVILVDRPWNDEYIAPSIVTRVGNWKDGRYGWDEILQIILDHNQQTSSRTKE